MLQKKLKYIFKQSSSYISAKLAFVNLNMIIGAIFYVFLIMVLGVNAYTAYNRGVQNLERLGEEQQKTDKLKQENAELQELYKYYGSQGYRKMYARDNLNLVERNETLYYIEKHEQVDIEQLPNTKKPIKVDNAILWRKLIFGI